MLLVGAQEVIVIFVPEGEYSVVILERKKKTYQDSVQKIRYAINKKGSPASQS